MVISVDYSLICFGLKAHRFLMHNFAYDTPCDDPVDETVRMTSSYLLCQLGTLKLREIYD